MAYTLFDATLALARSIEDVFEGTSTANGLTTTLVDANIFQPAGYFSDDPKGVLWLKTTVPASKIITGHVGTTITFAPAQAALVASGTAYAAAPGVYPRYALIQAINLALEEIGRIPMEGELAAVANQQEYTATDDVLFDEEIIGIEVANAAAAPYNWTPHYNWRQTAGVTRRLVFDEATVPSTTNKLRVLYLKAHTPLVNDGDLVSSHIHPDLLKWVSAVYAYRWRYSRTKADDPSTVDLLNEAKERVGTLAQEKLQEAQLKARDAFMRYPISRQRTVRHARW